jgi:S1-C subfamily serine protease
MTDSPESTEPADPNGLPSADDPAGPPTTPPAGTFWVDPAWATPPARDLPRTHWYERPTAVAILVAATVAAGIGIGRGAWPAKGSGPATVSAPRASSGGTSTTNPSSGSGGSNPSFGSGGSNPFSGSGGGVPFFGQGGDGSSGDGSGSSGSGSSGSGSSGSGTSTGPSDVSSIAAKVDPALVDINVTFNGTGAGAGTGIVLTSDGEILTNNHVVEGATSIRVTDIGNGKTYGATVVGYDRSDDVAVIQLTDASGLQTATIGDSSHVAVGDGVVAIGNAGGTGGTPSATGGSVTALDQSITASDDVTGTSENLTGLIETDANIQPGDSGGSLVDTSGRVVGMDSAAAQGFTLSSQSNQGYAIPINKALSIASQIESGGGSSSVHVGPTAYLGVLVSSDGGSSASGAVISSVVSGGPAADAGLTGGDVITSVAGNNVTSASDLTALIQQLKPGDGVQVGWTDSSGAAHTTTITLGAGPAQ